MAELRPDPFGPLITHLLRDLEEQETIFGLPRRHFHLHDPARDRSATSRAPPSAVQPSHSLDPRASSPWNSSINWSQAGTYSCKPCQNS